MTAQQPLPYYVPQPPPMRQRPTTSPNAYVALGLGLGALFVGLIGAVLAIGAFMTLAIPFALAALVVGIVALARREPATIAALVGFLPVVLFLAVLISTI